MKQYIMNTNIIHRIMTSFKLQLLLSIIIGLVIETSSYASTNPIDTIVNDAPIEKYTNYTQNLDELLNLYYIKYNTKEFLRPDTSQFSIDSIPSYSDSVYQSRLESLPSVIDLSYNKIVRSYIDMYTKQRRELVENMIGLSHYYFPLFEETLDKKGLPTELKYLAIIESALNPRAKSPVGATGLWQFMYGTGRMYKLTINSFIDQRMDPEISTIAAADFLTDLYKMYGDWTLALAAYNCGPGNVNKAIRRAGGKKDYWDIYYFLPRETRGYVPAFIAASYVLNFYAEHNFYPRPCDFPMATDTVNISQQLHIGQVSEVLNIPVKKIKDMNPQYKTDVIPGAHLHCYLTLPLDKISDFIDLEDSIYNYKDSVYFVKTTFVDPQKYTTSYYEHSPPANSTKLYYTVKSGDNIGFISEWYDVGASDIRYWNRISGNTIRVGQKLIVYVPNNKVNYYNSVNTLSFAEKQKRAGYTVKTSQPSTTVPEDKNATYTYYTVKRGDTLWDIAKLYPGVSAENIMSWNGITSASNVSPGMVLKIKQ